MRPVLFLVFLTLLLLLGSLARAAEAPKPSAAPEEPPAPAASPAVRMLLDEGEKLRQEQQSGEGLKRADSALAVARAATDGPGEAGAHRLRALCFRALGQPPPALAAWQEAAVAWRRAADGPGEVEALGEQALLRLETQPEEAERLLDQAVALARRETRRPRAAASVLHWVAIAFYQRGKPRLAELLWKAVLPIRASLAPGSGDLAATLNNLGLVRRERGDLDGAQQYYQQALAIQQEVAPGTLDLAITLNELALLAQARGDGEAAQRYYEHVLHIKERQEPASLSLAATLLDLGNVARDRGVAAAAHTHYERARGLLEQIAPGSLDLATTLNNLGTVAQDRGDLEAAQRYLDQALAIKERLAPGSLTVAATLNNRGSLARARGDLEAAKQAYEQTYAILEKMAPASRYSAITLTNLGATANDQGDLDGAKRFFQQALAIQVKLVPDSLDLSATLNNLGTVARARGDLDGAEHYHEQARAIQERLAPDSLALATTLNNLGGVAQERGDLDRARRYYEQDLAITQKAAPGSLSHTITLANLAALARVQGEPDRAQQYYEQAQALTAARAPNSAVLATILDGLGSIAADRADLESAGRYFGRALAIKEERTPGSLDLAITLHSLGLIARKRGDLKAAERFLERAWALVRTEGGRLSGDETRQRFGERNTTFASRLGACQLVLGKTAAAFRTVEEGRAQALLQILAERRLYRVAVPQKLQAEYAAAVQRQERIGEALARIGEAHAGDTVSNEAARVEEERLRGSYTDARLVTEGVWEKLKASVPGVFIEAGDPDQTRRALPRDVLFAAFSVGEKENVLFLVSSDGGKETVRAFPLEASEGDLRDAIDAFRSALTGARLERRAASLVRTTDHPDPLERLTVRSRELFRRLFPQDAREALTRAGGLVLSPDGPLWDLPFAALVMNERGRPKYLGLEKRLTYAQSLTLYARSLQDPPTFRGAARVLAVGNPRFAASPKSASPAVGANSQASSAATPVAVLRDREWGPLTWAGNLPGPLPFAEAEAREVARLYGGEPVLGTDATERVVRERAGDAHLLHLATHGYLHPIRATSSGLLLVPDAHNGEVSPQEDGALLAWELCELKLKAELVVLSACETGLGAKVRGEGLVGLTRALQVAGARSIVASQWQVSDASTKELMVRFHRELRAGKAKDAALREAMRAVAAQAETSHPFHWAAFLLVGDPENRGLARRSVGKQ